MWAVDARSGSNGPSAVATLTPIALHSLRALTKSAHIYEQLRHDDWVERRAGAAAVGDMDVGAHALHEALAGDEENTSTPSALAAAAALLAARRDDADRDVRSKAAEVIDRTKDDDVRLTTKRDRTVTRRRSDAEYCDAGDHPLLAIMEEWAKRAYRRMVPSKRALSLRVAGYVAAAAGAGADVVRRVLDREPGVAREADVLSKERRTMLHAAAAAGNGAALAPLLRAGADPGAADGHGATPLHLASRWGRGVRRGPRAGPRGPGAATRAVHARDGFGCCRSTRPRATATRPPSPLLAPADPLLRDGAALDAATSRARSSSRTSPQN
ncbi:hypothetical protein JL721_2780 [Aureococcus anophagefferens]|nr:hypothetical protein JL721_2780 [Aureococcus anophagefferens]